MKIKCNCGNLIPDQTDYLKYKGYIISDTQWFDFWDAIDDAIEKPRATEKERADLCMQLRRQNVFKSAWECSTCGKLFIADKKGDLILYSSDSKKYNRILDRKE